MANSKRKPHLIAYDIRLPKRLGRVFRYLKKHGLHIQYSVFLVQLNRDELAHMTTTLENMTKPVDDVRIYPLPSHPEWITHGKRSAVDDMLLSGMLGFVTTKEKHD